MQSCPTCHAPADEPVGHAVHDDNLDWSISAIDGDFDGSQFYPTVFRAKGTAL